MVVITIVTILVTNLSIRAAAYLFSERMGQVCTILLLLNIHHSWTLREHGSLGGVIFGGKPRGQMEGHRISSSLSKYLNTYESVFANTDKRPCTTLGRQPRRSPDILGAHLIDDG
jgi:hypothetical protein